MEDKGFDLNGFLNDPKIQQNKPAAIQFLIARGVIDERGNVIGKVRVPVEQEQPSSIPTPTVGGYARNVLSSGANFLGNVAKGVANIFNPNLEQNTVSNVARLAAGATERGFSAVTGKPIETSDTQLFDAAANYFKDRYGIEDFSQGNLREGALKVAKTMYEDPIGFLTDLSVAIAPAKAALTRVAPGTSAAITKTVGSVNETTKLSNTLGAVVKKLAPKTYERISELHNVASMSLAKGSQNLTDAKISQLGKGYDETMKWILDHTKKSGRAQLADEVSGLYVNAEKVLGDTFSGKLSMQKSVVNKALDDIALAWQKSPDYNIVLREIQKARAAIERGTGKSSVVEFLDVNTVKKNFWDKAFAKNDVDVVNDIAFDVADALSKTIKDVGVNSGIKVKFMGKSMNYEEFNKAYQSIIKARGVTQLALNRPEMSSITARLLGGAIGAQLGGAGAALGAAAGPSTIGSVPLSTAKLKGARILRGAGDKNIPLIRRIAAPASVGQRIQENQ